MGNMSYYERKEESAYQIALECVKREHCGGCNKDCPNCGLNIGFMLDDPRDAVRIKAQAIAAMSGKFQKDAEDALTGKILLVLLVVGFGWLLWQCNIVGPNKKKLEMNRSAELVAATLPQTRYTQAEIDADKEWAWAALEKVHENIYDFNGDEVINCQDYSMLYYHYAERKEDVQFVENTNKQSNFYHLFIRVRLVDGEWYTVEPQGFRDSKDGKSTDPGKFWGSIYSVKNDDFSEVVQERWRTEYEWQKTLYRFSRLGRS